MASANTVHVKNIGSKTDDKEIKDFFSFWYVHPLVAFRPATPS